MITAERERVFPFHIKVQTLLFYCKDVGRCNGFIESRPEKREGITKNKM